VVSFLKSTFRLGSNYTKTSAMPNNLNQPKTYDLVLGGQTLTPAYSAVLGGLAGVKRRFGRGNPGACNWGIKRPFLAGTANGILATTRLSRAKGYTGFAGVQSLSTFPMPVQVFHRKVYNLCDRYYSRQSDNAQWWQ
jgi:hypothetical protein